MKNTKLIILLLSITLSSCRTVYYIPNSVNIPLFKEKGEKSFTANVGLSEHSNNLGISGAYSLTNCIGTIFNATLYNGNKVNGPYSGGNYNYNPERNGKMVEMGIGFYKPIAFEDKIIFENYIGYSLLLANVARNSTQSVSYQMHRPFIQPSIGFRSKYFEVAFGLRMAKTNFSDVTFSSMLADDPETVEVFYTLNNKMLIEPSFTIRAGTESIKLQFQFVGTSHPNVDALPIDPVNLSAGLHLRF